MTQNSNRDYEGPCHYCQKPTYRTRGQRKPPFKNDEATLDHILPKSKGGTRRHSVNCCHSCNQRKGDMSYAAFIKLIDGR